MNPGGETSREQEWGTKMKRRTLYRGGAKSSEDLGGRWVPGGETRRTSQVSERPHQRKEGSNRAKDGATERSAKELGRGSKNTGRRVGGGFAGGAFRGHEKLSNITRGSSDERITKTTAS